ncbi:hypothetical protein GQ42DRAFT_163136 [Ramicandelaber brevisporus]|nr:hypothetical protein GQ42DRAFT_163136 [Ramicandelaber brevisporus]
MSQTADDVQSFQTDQPRPVVWTSRLELALFQSMGKARPVGLHSHFHMLNIYSQFSARLADSGPDITIADIWQKLGSMYDLDAFSNDQQQTPSPTDDMNIDENIIAEEQELLKEQQQQQQQQRDHSSHSSLPPTLFPSDSFEPPPPADVLIAEVDDMVGGEADAAGGEEYDHYEPVFHSLEDIHHAVQGQRPVIDFALPADEFGSMIMDRRRASKKRRKD